MIEVKLIVAESNDKGVAGAAWCSTTADPITSENRSDQDVRRVINQLISNSITSGVW